MVFSLGQWCNIQGTAAVHLQTCLPLMILVLPVLNQPSSRPQTVTSVARRAGSALHNPAWSLSLLPVLSLFPFFVLYYSYIACRIPIKPSDAILFKSVRYLAIIRPS